MPIKNSEEKLDFIWKEMLFGKGVQRAVDLSQVSFL